MLAEGSSPDIAKHLTGLGGGVMELALKHRGGAFRVVYALQIDNDIWIIHAGQKKSKSGIKTPRQDMTLCKSGHGNWGDAKMTDELDIIRGSRNLFRDLGHPDAERERPPGSCAPDRTQCQQSLDLAPTPPLINQRMTADKIANP